MRLCDVKEDDIIRIVPKHDRAIVYGRYNGHSNYVCPSHGLLCKFTKYESFDNIQLICLDFRCSYANINLRDFNIFAFQEVETEV